MGLYANGYRLGNTPFKGGLGALVSIYNGGGTNFNHRQPNSSLRTSSGLFGQYAALPNGNLNPSCWMLPQKSGGMSSHNIAGMSFSSSALLLGGKALEGSTSITISTNTPDGELIVSGEGSSSFTISTNTPLLTASISGEGTAAFTISANSPILGAIADLTGSGAITFSASLTAYARGYMTGTTEESGLTVSGITNSVWNAILANYPTSGTAGNALGLASSGGVDYDTLAAAVLAAAQSAPIHANTKKINDVTVIGQGTDPVPWGGSP